MTILLNGVMLASFEPARIVHGRIVAPLNPIVSRIATRVVYRPADATVELDRLPGRAIVPVVFVQSGQPFIELGPAVRRLGGSADFDRSSKTVTIAFPPDAAIASPPAYRPGRPVVAPTAVFTPTTRPEPPRGIDTGIPRPRRTAIPVQRAASEP